MPSGQQVTSFSIATNRVWKDAQGQKKEEAEFHNIVTFGKLADISSRYLNKGSLVLIEGRIKTRNWTDSGGIKHYKTEIIADSLQLGPKGTGGSSGNSGNSNYSKPFSSHETEQPRSEEIPIIEENYAPPATNQEDEGPKQVSFDGDAADEIDVKDIPF